MNIEQATNLVTYIITDTESGQWARVEVLETAGPLTGPQLATLADLHGFDPEASTIERKGGAE